MTGKRRYLLATRVKNQNKELKRHGVVLAERGGFEPPIELLNPITV
jgi:hypothetical protein